MPKSENPSGFVTETFKTGIINPQGFFLFEQLLFDEVDFTASNFEVAVQLQIEVKRKMLGRSVTFGPKSVEKRLLTASFFN